MEENKAALKKAITEAKAELTAAEDKLQSLIKENTVEGQLMKAQKAVEAKQLKVEELASEHVKMATAEIQQKIADFQEKRDNMKVNVEAAIDKAKIDMADSKKKLDEKIVGLKETMKTDLKAA